MQALLTQLSAQNARLSNSLTQLTDEILRSGGRLAYEVEILRGETVGFSETLDDVLREDIQKLAPATTAAAMIVQVDDDQPDRRKGDVADIELSANGQGPSTDQDPHFIMQLRMLGQVKSRLEDVIHTFGEAMEWPMPPSELSVTSSLISVSGPDLGPESHSREEKGRDAARRFRTEIFELFDSEGGGLVGVDKAGERLESLRSLAGVWKGTAEEKARNKFIDGLTKLVEDKRRTLEAQDSSRRRSMEGLPMRNASGVGMSSMDQIREERTGGDVGGGFMSNLKKLRNEIYLE